MVFIKATFEIGKVASTRTKYVGVNLNQKEECIALDQVEYIGDTEEVEITDSKDGSRQLSREEQRLYRGICGQLNWIATQSRPEVAFDVCLLSTKLNEAK